MITLEGYPLDRRWTAMHELAHVAILLIDGQHPVIEKVPGMRETPSDPLDGLLDQSALDFEREVVLGMHATGHAQWDGYRQMHAALLEFRA